jgi:hypothetical protein
LVGFLSQLTISKVANNSVDSILIVFILLFFDFNNQSVF